MGVLLGRLHASRQIGQLAWRVFSMHLCEPAVCSLIDVQQPHLPVVPPIVKVVRPPMSESVHRCCDSALR